MTLTEFITRHSARNACRCRTCAIPGDDIPLEGNTADVIFFDVALTGEVTAEEFITALSTHTGVGGQCNLLDGREHNYKEISSWVGDQEMAIRLMGMGSLLQMWELLTPLTEFGPNTPKDVALQMAQQGLLAIQVPASS